MEIKKVGGVTDIAPVKLQTDRNSTLLDSHSDASSQPVKNDRQNEEPVAKETLDDAVDKANAVFQTFTTHLQFKIHEDTGRYYVAVINDETNEVIREIPPKKFLDMVAAMEKMMKGIFIDELK